MAAELMRYYCYLALKDDYQFLLATDERSDVDALIIKLGLDVAVEEYKK
jgi:hypothetical protein